MKIKLYWFQDSRSFLELKPLLSDSLKAGVLIQNLNKSRKWNTLLFEPKIFIFSKIRSEKVELSCYDVESKNQRKECTLIGAKGFAKKFLKAQYKKLGIEVDVD